jgi:LPXTG-motif cell wall-anchored protein
MDAIARFSEETGQNDITWLLWVALGLFALMVVVGWLSSRKQKPEPGEPATQAHEPEKHE